MENTNNRELRIERVFNAPREMLWKAWTDPELCKKWWGPGSFTAPVIKIDFRVGGKYLFCMRGSAAPGQPEQDFWSGGTYREIVPLEKIVCSDHFSNEKGDVISPVDYGMPEIFPKENIMTVTFEEEGDSRTKMTILYTVESEAILKVMLDVQMKEGWESSVEKLAKSVE